jgi:hypothetical protein
MRAADRGQSHVVLGGLSFTDSGHCRQHIDVRRRRRIPASSDTGTSDRPDYSNNLSKQSSAFGELSYPNFADLQERATVFEALASVQTIGFALDTHNGTQSRITLGDAVSSEFFKMLRLQPELGRAFRPEEDAAPGRDAVAVISYSMWQRDFGGNVDVLGKTIQLNRKNFTIIGVAPRQLNGVQSMIHPDLYVPRMMAELLADPGVHPLTDRTQPSVAVYARLKPGAGIEEARTEVTRIGAQLEQENPAANRKQSLAVFTQTGLAFAEDTDAFSAGMLFLLVGALVLGIACVNVANLLLSTAPARTRENRGAPRDGRPRSRLVRQFLLESCILSAAATAAGMAERSWSPDLCGRLRSVPQCFQSHSTCAWIHGLGYLPSASASGQEYCPPSFRRFAARAVTSIC